MCFVVLRCILERENSCEILQYLGETKANQILKPKVVPEKKQYSRTRFQLILPVHSHKKSDGSQDARRGSPDIPH